MVDRAEKIANAKSFKAGDEIKIPCAILSLFHLLPRAPEKFLEKLVHVTMELEKSLPGSTREGRHWSPFREKLVPYMNRHAPEAVVYFLEKIKLGPRPLQAAAPLVKCAEGTELRNELANSTAALVATTFDAKFTVANPALATQTRLQERSCVPGDLLVHTLVKRMPAWLPSPTCCASSPTSGCPPSASSWLTSRSRCRSSKSSNRAAHQVLRVVLPPPRLRGDDGGRQVELLFMMLSIFSEHTLVNYLVPQDVLSRRGGAGVHGRAQAECIKHLLTFFQTREVAQDDKVQALSCCCCRCSPPPSPRARRAPCCRPRRSRSSSRAARRRDARHLRRGAADRAVELATLLIEHVPDQLVEHRKELIKFAWNHLKSEDTQSKQCAYVNVCRFIQVYDTPPKIILQVYVALLRTFQPDARALVKQALDIGRRRCRALPAGDHKYPTWIKWTKKIIVEEGHSLPQLIHIWQLVVRHPSLFFSSSAQFVPQMVNSLNRIGLSPNCSVENRKLAVELAQLIISWELQRCATAAAAAKRPKPEPSAGAAGAAAGEPPAKQQRVDDAGAKAPTAAGAAPAAAPAAGAPGAAAPAAAGAPGAAPAAAPAPAPAPADDEFKPSAAIVEVLINFLIRVADRGRGEGRGGALGPVRRSLDQGLGVWPDANIKFQYFEKQLQATSQESATALLTFLAILRSILKAQPKFLLKNLRSLTPLLRPAFEHHTANDKMVVLLCDFLRDALASLAEPPGAPPAPELGAFLRWLSEMIGHGLLAVSLSKEAAVAR